jgi:hypothetical protein
VSITMKAEELARQYLNGKSIRELSHETGKGEWAIRKQIQRYLNRQKVTQEIQPEYQEQEKTLARKEKPLTAFAAAIFLIGFMFMIYFVYMEIKKKRENSSN